ncbi:uncharacterized protein LOC119078330 [Bradysia coprophila]|uniref:uncharacterized protein LOC119078330 n=1 Tax=Bradysia coprophila TaxID=38358 RepID=UPI00187D8A68|nr:uncharacterized protein LOC119078330 [Bradysia coprophila]
MDHNSGPEDEIQREVALRREEEDFTDPDVHETERQIAKEIAAMDAVSNLGEQIESEWEARNSVAIAQWDEDESTAVDVHAGAWNVLADFRPSESYPDNSHRLAELDRHTNDKNVVGRMQVEVESNESFAIEKKFWKSSDGSQVISRSELVRLRLTLDEKIEEVERREVVLRDGIRMGEDPAMLRTCFATLKESYQAKEAAETRYEEFLPKFLRPEDAEEIFARERE